MTIKRSCTPKPCPEATELEYDTCPPGCPPEPTPIDSSCDAPVFVSICPGEPLQVVLTNPTPDVEKLEYCNPDTETMWVKACNYAFDAEGVAVETVLSDSDTGIACSDWQDDIDVEKQETCNTETGTMFYRVCRFVTDSDGVTTEEVITDWTDSGIPCKQSTETIFCKKWQTLAIGFDNTGTVFNWTSTFEITNSDGSIVTFDQTPTAGWTEQIEQWAASIQALYPDCIVEPRCNLPNGCGGLLGPVSDAPMPKMFARYVHISCCPTGVYPVSAKILNGDGAGKDLVTDFNSTPIKFGFQCVDCEGNVGPLKYEDGTDVLEADLPACTFPCEQNLPETPESQCSVDIIPVCEIQPEFELDPDTVIDASIITSDLYLQFVICGSDVDSYAYDADGNPHTLADGNYYGNCDDLEPIDPPLPECPEGAKFEPVQVGGHYFILDNSNWEGSPTAHIANGHNFEFTFTFDDGSTKVVQQTADPMYNNMIANMSAELGCAVLPVCANHTSPKGCNLNQVANLAMYPAYDTPTSPGDIQNNLSNPDQSELWASGWLIDCGDCQPKVTRVEITNSNTAGYIGAFKEPIVYDKDKQLIYQAVTCEGTFYKDCDGNSIASPSCCPTPYSAPSCGVPTGKTKCYKTAGGTTTVYTNGDNATDISASNNPTTIKWQIQLGQDPDADATGPAIAACISSEGFATIDYTYVGGITTTFTATSVIADGTATGGWAFSGTGAASSSGKLISATISCGDAAGTGEAMQFYDCDLDVFIWVDCLNTGIFVDAEDLIECPVEKECLETNFQLAGCVESGQTLPEGTNVLTIGTLDCNNVLVSSETYVLPDQTLYSGEPLSIDYDCGLDVEQLRECIVDTNGVVWTQVAILDSDGVVIGDPIYYDSSLAIGTPAGDPREFTVCPNDSGLVDIEKTCIELFGSVSTGYLFAYSDGEVQIGTTQDPSSATPNANIFCCDDCIQVFGCRDGRLAWPAGSEVTMSNGDILDISGLRYSQVAQLIVDTYGGTFIAPSLGGPIAPNFSQCQGSSQHELQFYNVPFQIESIDEMDNYGTFGKCKFECDECSLLEEIRDLLTCKTCPELIVGDTVNSNDSSVLSFPLNANSVVIPFTTPITIEYDECLADEIVIRVTQDHEAGAYPNHRGYILSASSGIWTAESASNTFETSGTIGTANIGIGYAATDPIANQRNIRWTELTVSKADLLAGITLSGLGFGGFGGATEDIYSMSWEIVSGKEACDGCT